MALIKLHTPMHFSDKETVTEFEANDVKHIASVVGNDDAQGTHFYLEGVPKKQFCIESANEVKELVRMNKDAPSGQAVHNYQIGTVIGGLQINSPSASQQVNVVMNQQVREAIEKLGGTVANSELDAHDKDEVKHALERISQLASQPQTEKSKSSVLEKLEMIDRVVKVGTAISPVAIPLIKMIRSHFGG